MTFAIQARSSPTKAAEMDYLTAALHSKPFRPPRAPAAYVSDLFDLEARKSAFLQSQAQRASRTGSGSGPDHSSQSLTEANKGGADHGMFYDVHGLIFDYVAPNMREMIEAALGLPPQWVGGSSGHGATVREGGASSLKWLDILDLGCGNGRMGRQLEPLANYMTGIDLSEEAIKQAMRRRTYDSIKHGDVLTVTKVRTILSCVAADVHRLPFVPERRRY